MKHKNKSGQATAFIILGIIIVALALIGWFLKDQFFFGPITPASLEEKGIVPIRDHINDCVNEVAPDYFERIGLQGGYLSTPVDTFRKRNDIPISYLCYNMENVPVCYNRYLTKNHMEEELSEAIKQGLSTCLNVKKFAKGFDVNIGALDVNVNVGDYVSLVNVNFPIILKKKEVTVKEDSFVSEINIPLGALYGVSQDIIDVETQVGEFEQVSYMLAHKGQFVIDKKKPYPDKLYILKTKDSDYIFQFFVQGEPL